MRNVRDVCTECSVATATKDGLCPSCWSKENSFTFNLWERDEADMIKPEDKLEGTKK
ncbi:hypothetical protein ADP65_00005 [Achromobacter phage phiAxp-3]|uniref:Uncharacterized protein n=1 Tax=Achromobacter phage phiAxp-3 TaxID=1664247 RepID=A0A0K2FHY2_9CAUD|nr:hypothetical protein ADP65_00005 [Achromobacter phage phiAxp-3]ALA45474.1 hypothetical protein ADP65_00005 [Achromobacter phage phiAxp-3]